MTDHHDARVAALHKAIEDERLEDLRRAKRFLQLANKVRAFRDDDGPAPTEAELSEWADHTAKAAAVAERLAELSALGEAQDRIAAQHVSEAHDSAMFDFGDSTSIAASEMPHSQRSPQIEWTENFAYAFVELATDAGQEAPDVALLRARGAGLWLEHHDRDAIEIALQEFDKRKKG